MLKYSIIVLILHVSKVMLKILQARLQQYMNHELPDVQAGFRKAKGTRHQIASIHWLVEKAGEFQKNTYFCFVDYAKAFDCGSQQTVENSERDGNNKYPTTWPASWETCMQVKKQLFKLYMAQWTGSKFREEYVKAV